MSPPADPLGRTVRIATWNIHGGVGADRRCDLGRTVRAIHDFAPDVAALQEVDGRAWAGRQAGAFERLAEALGGHVTEARLTAVGAGAYGHVLWSRWPIRAAAVRRLPGGRIEPRAAIDATVLTPLGSLRVLSAHFGLVPGDRRRQAAALAGFASERDGPTVALGDFNDWRLGSGAVHRALLPVLPRFAAPRTWPAGRPFVAMDRIYSSCEVDLIEARTINDARAASDHLPLVAELSF